MNAVSAATSRTPYVKPISPSAPAPAAAPFTPAASPTPAAAITLSAQAQNALSSAPPQPRNIIWGS